MSMRRPQAVDDAQKLEYSKAARDARNKYAREWRARHPENVKLARIRYWERRAEKDLENARSE